ncbi:hypothetical protein [Phycicoccus flavus]|uniref:hypothetical protein n=1 Tax=Phycicoccus flavus TaxID=2502783 RepID=UPI000FEB980F|nr:hypothetical protein [Phycicoccus flavus]NHA69667.1 hypothetical protein [Phycicoccus flavus]
MRRAVTSVITTALVAAGLGVAAAPATPAVTVSLAGYTDMAVDGTHGRVLITSGDATSSITVLGLDGSRQGTIPGVAGAQDIHLATDRSAFYVSLRSQKAIGVIDASTLAVTKIALGVCPTSVAQQDQVLWFTYSCSGQDGMIGSVQLSDGTVTTGLSEPRWYLSRVESSPGLPGRLVARQNGTLFLVDTTAGATAPVSFGASASTDARDFALTPDGKEVVATDDSPYRHVGFSTTDMTVRTIYPTAEYPNAVAVRGDGLVAAGLDNASRGVYLYREGSASLFRSYRVGDDVYDSLVLRGLEFGSRDLYALSSRWDGSGTVVWTLQRFTRSARRR